MEFIECYCIKCKTKVRSYDFVVKVSESERKMAMGKCPTCGTKVNKIIGKADWAETIEGIQEDEKLWQS